MALEPGFVPDGWERGDLLEVRDAPAGGFGMVMRKMGPMRQFGSPRMHDVAVVQFHDSERAQLKSWLTWWVEGR